MSKTLAAIMECLPPPVREFVRDTCWFLSTGHKDVLAFTYPLHEAARRVVELTQELETRGVAEAEMHRPAVSVLPQAWRDERWMIVFRGDLDLSSETFARVVLEEIAHSWLGHDHGASDRDEPQAKRLVGEWMSFVRGDT